jgi:hypothetical protein
LNRQSVINFGAALEKMGCILKDFHPPVIVNRKKNIETSHFRFRSSVVMIVKSSLTDQAELDGGRVRVILQCSTIVVHRTLSLDGVKRAPVRESG